MFGKLLTTCLFIRYISCELQFVVSNNTSPWLTANYSCDLLQPDSTTTEDGTTIVEGMGSDTNITESGVGVYRFGYWLSYRGCRDVSGRDPNFTTLTVGSCFELCGEDKYGTIGLKNSSCYCYNLSPSFTKVTCGHSCPTEPFICGSLTKNSASIYRWTKEIGATVDEDGGNCLAIINSRYTWRQCNVTLPLKCSNYTDDKTGVWPDHIGRCSQPKIENTPNSSNNTWTHTIRSVSTRIHKADKGPISTVNKYIVSGYVFQSNNRTYLKFTSPSEEKRYICLSDNEESTLINNGNQTESDNEDSMLNNNGNQTESDYIIGGASGVVVIVLLVVIVSVRVKCFRKKLRISREMTSSDEGPNIVRSVPNAVPEVVLESALSTGSYNQVGVAVNSAEQYDDPIDAIRGQHNGVMAARARPPDDYDYALTYDHRRRRETRHVYSHVRIQNGVVTFVEEVSREVSHIEREEGVYDTTATARATARSDRRLQVKRYETDDYDTVRHIAPKTRQTTRSRQFQYSYATEPSPRKMSPYSLATEV